MTCTCNVGPGKFEGEPAIAALAYYHMLHGMDDFTVGDRTYFQAPFHFNAYEDAARFAEEVGYCALCIAKAFTDPSAGLVVWDDDVGFVHCQLFDTADALTTDVAVREEAEADEDTDD